MTWSYSAPEFSKWLHYGSDQPVADTCNGSLTHKLGSERKSECSGAREQSEQCGANKWVSSAREGENGRANGPIFTCQFIAVLNHGGLRSRVNGTPLFHEFLWIWVREWLFKWSHCHSLRILMFEYCNKSEIHRGITRENEHLGLCFASLLFTTRPTFLAYISTTFPHIHYGRK